MTTNNDPSRGQLRKAAYTIIERGEGIKPYWLRVGTAFTNRDGSINILLDAVPTNGKLHVRDYDPDRNRRREFGDRRGAAA